MPERKLILWNLLPRNSRGWASINGQKGVIAVLELGIPHELRNMDRYNKPQEFIDFYRSVNPDPEAKPVVPALEDTDGTRLVESAVIAEYLSAKYGNESNRLVPADAKQAATARLFIAVYQSNFDFLKWLRAEKEEAVTQLRKNYIDGMKTLDAFLRLHGSSDGPFLLGNKYSIAEMLTASGVLISRMLLMAVRDFDPVAEAKAIGAERYAQWMQAVLDRPSTKESSMHDPAKISVESWQDWIKENPNIGL